MASKCQLSGGACGSVPKMEPTSIALHWKSDVLKCLKEGRASTMIHTAANLGASTFQATGNGAEKTESSG